MPFYKLDLCEGTQVAFNVFHMFRGNTINMVEMPTPDGMSTTISQYEHKYVGLEDEAQPYDNSKLNVISIILTQECDLQVRIHDLRKSGEAWQESERRLVQFCVGPRNSVFGLKEIIFSITVGRDYLDGDEVSGVTAWRMLHAEFKSFTCGGECHELSFKLKASIICDEDIELSPQMKEDVGRLVHFF